MSDRRGALEEQVLGQKWFYRFRLPSGRETELYINDEIENIHRTRRSMMLNALQPLLQQAGDQLTALDFASLVPGHGQVMNRDDFAAYRLAFTGFVDCSNSERPMESCAGGWMNAAKRWLGDGETASFVDMAGYYGDLIRSGKLSKNCPA